MRQKESKRIQRRLLRSYLTSAISMSLVLFMLGMIALLWFPSVDITRHIRESFTLSMMLREPVSDNDVRLLETRLREAPYVRSTRFISREDAVLELQEEVGSDFVEFLGYNPLSSAIEVHLVAEYTHPDSIASIETKLMKLPKVEELLYQKPLIQVLHENIRKISLAIFLFSALLFSVAVSLINSTIRITVYSRRFMIRTMQLVGASAHFIRKPFLIRGFWQGLVSACVAMGLLLVVMYWLRTQMPMIAGMHDLSMKASLFGILLGVGVALQWLCTILAVNHYLRMKTDQLYY